ncbi:TerC family protein [Acidisphaera sp. L21]|uniref:TerC family protein n=1 Tax=Acidisphaera sp. L21 TaxID=1641851 RepID=UPI00131CE5FF|nr:TerC family protein [Acidisphaera sp. L21]
MAWLADPHIWASFVTLSTLEIVLGVDNLVFLSLLAGRLPPLQRAAGRRVGLGLALLTRLALLGSISWLANLTQPVIAAAGHDISLRDLILLGGGLFLLVKGTREILSTIEGEAKPSDAGAATPGFFSTIVQIALLDIVFSLDSVITAVGIAQDIWVMVAAIVLAMFVMLLASTRLAAFIEHHASVKMLALAFILLIGCVLVADGAGLHIPRGTIYAAMGFAVLVESLNLLAARRRHQVKRAPTPASRVALRF